MKTLLLLRHAKSSWSTSAQRDFDRPLNERGRRAAGLMGAYMQAKGLRPDIIYCSGAARTRETLSRLNLTPAPPAMFKDQLYLASARRLLDEIHAASDAHGSLLLVGHNPGMEELSAALVDPARSNSAMIQKLSEKYPTAALAHFEFDAGHWADIALRRGVLKRFQRPRDLAHG